MKRHKYECFVSANEELRDFLGRVECLVGGTGMITERDLRILSQYLAQLAPEVGNAAHDETLDASVRNEITQYVNNLRALQPALEKVRCFMLARKMQLETSKRHLNGVQGWVNAYNQTM